MDLERLKKLRRTLHESPEPSFNEFKTAEIILDFFNEVTKGSPLFKVHRPFLSSIVIDYHNGGDMPYKLFRADMDAIKVDESPTHEIVSKNPGVMHACGHDIHMTVLCGILAEVAEKLPEKNILFVFQPGEEGAGGARKMIESGVFDKYDIEAAHAIHVNDDFLVGEIASNDNVLFAIPREVDVVFEGKTAHAAFPERGHDALAAAAEFLTVIEHNIRKNINPTETFHAHFGKLVSGTARNVVSGHSKIEGTLRSFTSEMMDAGTKIVEETAQRCAEAYGCTSKLTILGEYIEVRNTPELFAKLKTAAEKHNIRCICKKGDLVGEDFGYFTRKWSGIMFWVGCRKDPKAEPVSLHSNLFFPDFGAVEVALKLMLEMLEK